MALSLNSKHSTGNASLSNTVSMTSVDLDFILASHASCLLSELCSFDSLSSAFSDDVPPVPSGCMVPMSTFLSLGNHLSMFPTVSERVGEFHETDELATTTITIPTPPRLRTMLKETLCVSKWVENLVVSDAPGHSPWDEIQAVSPVPHWIPEGSVYPPEEFKEALSGGRRPKNVRHFSDSAREACHSVSSSRSRACRPNRTSSREELVFEKDITLHSEGRAKRWSLQVPASTMNPEMVGIMLELQDLNSFFKNGLADLDNSVASLDHEKDKLVTPALMVSDSHSTLPLFVDSPERLTFNAPVPLAARRGRKMLKPLSFQRPIHENPYPGIPTAFLGSPSTYSPKFEFANDNTGPSMDLQNMVHNLRSQYNTLPGRSPHLPKFHDGYTMKSLKYLESSSLPSFEDEEEWLSREIRAMPKCHGDYIGQEDAPLSTAVSIGVPEKAAISPSFTQSFPGNSHKTLPFMCPPPPIPLPPLPPTPVLAKSRRTIQGILKNGKSVRFASLPSRHQTWGGMDLTPPVASGPAGILEKQRSPLRRSDSPTDTAASSIIKRSLPATRRGSNTGATVPGTKTKRMRSGTIITSPLSVVSPSGSTSPLDNNAQILIGSPLHPSFKHMSGRCDKQASSLRLHSLTGFRKSISTSTAKENKPRSFISPNKPRAVSHMLNENIVRREDPSQQSSQKSRMPVPLRKIFTRFK